MKKLMLVSTGLLMTLCFTLGTTHAFAQKSEDAAIKKVINEETSSFFHKDYDAWAATWAHDTASAILRIGPAGYGQLSGWYAISTQYRQNMQNLQPRTEAEIAPFLVKTDWQIFINGNMATVSYKEGKEDQTPERRTMIKQNGTWKNLSLTTVNSGKYNMKHLMDYMRVFVGKWILDGTPTSDPSNGLVLNSAEFVLWETPTGLEQTSKFMVTNNKGMTNASPTAYEYFIPDNTTNKIFYLSVDKNHAGQTFTETGTITSEKINSFTVTTYYSGKSGAKKTEYTVSLENGKWHQVGKSYDINGKVTWTNTMDFRRL